MTELALFDIEPIPTPEPAEKLSADRRRTMRQHADVERGIHPITQRRVHPDSARTCGTCVFRQLLHGGSRSYPKCTFPTAEVGTGPLPRVTSSAASDIRAWWPGCSDHRPKEGDA